jgi:hypothetical protein
MAQLTLLQIAQAVTGELGLVQPSVVVGATDLQTVQILNLINREGDNLKRTHNWTQLQTLFTLNVGPPTVTTGNVTLSSPVITNIPSTAGLTAELFCVSGSQIPVAARLLNLGDQNGNNPTTSVTLDMVATGTVANTALTFAQDTYPENADFDRFLNGTAWDRTNRWALLGPDSPQLDEYHRSGIVTTGPRRHFRQVGNLTAGTYRIWPAPAIVDTPFQIAWEYLSLNWVRVNGGSTLAASMVNDADTPILDSQALILGAKWRFLQAKGIPTAASMQTEYLDYVQQLIARDGGAPTLTMGRRWTPYLLNTGNVQDANFPAGAGSA